MFHLFPVDLLFGPLEGGGVLIPASDKGFDCLYQHFDAGKAGPLQCAGAQNAKSAFHLIEPGGAYRDEMKIDPGSKQVKCCQQIKAPCGIED